jgi:hypothetical protein
VIDPLDVEESINALTAVPAMKKARLGPRGSPGRIADSAEDTPRAAPRTRTTLAARGCAGKQPPPEWGSDGRVDGDDDRLLIFDADGGAGAEERDEAELDAAAEREARPG